MLMRPSMVSTSAVTSGQQEEAELTSTPLLSQGENHRGYRPTSQGPAPYMRTPQKEIIELPRNVEQVTDRAVSIMTASGPEMRQDAAHGSESAVSSTP